MHKASGYSMFTNCSSDSIKSMVDCYRGKDYANVLWEFKRACSINNQLWKKEIIIPLTDGENKSYEKVKVCYICKK